jgi:hypothetical protein
MVYEMEAAIRGRCPLMLRTFPAAGRGFGPEAILSGTRDDALYDGNYSGEFSP